MILHYEFALSVNLEKICGVHLENENLRFFLNLEKNLNKNMTQTPTDNELQIF